jgi:hypothetical protein
MVQFNFQPGDFEFPSEMIHKDFLQEKSTHLKIAPAIDIAIVHGRQTDDTI